MNRAASNNVTTGNKLVTGTVRVEWKANRSYFWELYSGVSELFVNGNIAYCIEPSIFQNVAMSSATGTTVENTGLVKVHPDGRLAYKLSYAQEKELELISNYGNKYPGHNTTAYKWATQIMIWESLGWDVTSYGGLVPTNEINVIKSLIADHNAKPSWNNQVRDVVIGQEVTLEYNLLDKFSVNSNLTTGLTVVSKTASTITVKINSKNASLGLIKIGGSAQGTSYIYTDGTSQKVGDFKISDPSFAIIDFSVKKGNLSLTKKGVDGKTYSGVVFELSKNRHDIIGTSTTGANGSVNVNNLDEGIYYVREKKVPSPLIIDSTWKSISIVSGQTASFEAVNELAMGKIIITKFIKGTNTTIAGAVFEVKNSSGSVVDTITTNAQGIATSKVLPLGNYTVVEKSVPAPYILDSTPIQANILYKDQLTPIVSISVKQENEVARGRIEFTKKSNHGDLMSGVKFNILDASKNVVGTLTTGANVKATSTVLPLGTYQIVEISTIHGFVLDTTPQSVTIAYKDQLTPIVLVGKELTNKHQL